MNLGQSLNTEMRLSQKMILTTGMLQSLEIIQMNTLELKERIEDALKENPALEIPERHIIERSVKDKDIKKSKETSLSHNSGTNKNYIEEIVASRETLQDILNRQLDITYLSPREKEIGQTIISLIDSDGFFKEDPKAVFGDEEFTALKVLTIMKDFDPPGIAAYDIKEALIYQLEDEPPDPLVLKAIDILEHDFELIAEKKSKTIMADYGLDQEQTKDLFTLIGRFNPYPGRHYTNAEIGYIVPDAYIFRVDGELKVKVNNDYIPHLIINKELLKLVKNKNTKRSETTHSVSEADIKYINGKIAEANAFIDMIDGRKKSLERLVSIIAEYQREFFEKGPSGIKPFTMKKAAEMADLSESTISRLCSNKYIQTEWGIRSLKFFFSSGIQTKDSDVVNSSVGIKEMIKEIIMNDNDNSLSDSKIAEILQNRGIEIKTRTVNKYRNKLNILSSQQRGV